MAPVICIICILCLVCRLNAPGLRILTMIIIILNLYALCFRHEKILLIIIVHTRISEHINYVYNAYNVTLILDQKLRIRNILLRYVNICDVLVRMCVV